jgi:hypothetical protein
MTEPKVDPGVLGPPIPAPAMADVSTQLREAITVLDGPFHRDAVAGVLEQAANAIADRGRELQDERLSHQETRGAVAAWKQEYATLERKLAQIVQWADEAECSDPENCTERHPRSLCVRCRIRLTAKEAR